MSPIFENTRREAPLYYFQQLAAIPHESGKEKALSDYILAWAQDLGLEAYQNEVWTLIIKKPASEGYEDREPVLLQAHMDMVCEKNQESDFDFDHDAIPLMLDGDWLKSAAGTTLGADDGIGVAMIMAMLADESLAHPPLEAILTTQEETTFAGAKSVDWTKLSGRRLINIDNCVENQILCASCGGTGIHFKIPMNRTSKTDGVQLQLFLTGLCGGHSGEDIHRGHGNAFELMSRVLICSQAQGASFIEMHGGSSRTAIPREAAMTVWVPTERQAALTAALGALEAQLRDEYEVAAPELALNITAEPVTKTVQVAEAASTQKLLSALFFLPNGVQEMNAAFPGTVANSSNIGIVQTTEEMVEMVAEARCATESAITYMQQKCILLAEMVGGSCAFFDMYDPWQYRSNSTLRQTARQVYEQVTGREMTAVVIHAGIECGFFLKERPDLDAISLGPDAVGFHAPGEKLSISSVLRDWEFLVKLLEKC